MTETSINKLMEDGWNKAMAEGKDAKAECCIFTPKQMEWYMFGFNLAVTVKELKGETNAPSVIINFTPAEEKWFRGGQA